MPLSELPARQNRSATEARRKKRSVTLQSIWTVGLVVAPTSASRAVTARATA
jgi:hypothetical protein